MKRVFPLLMLMTPCVAMAQAGPPMITNDPGTPGAGKWEINLAVVGERASDKSRQTGAPDVDINYGVGERIQLSVHLSSEHLKIPGQRSRTGFGDVEFAARYRFMDQDQYGVNIAVQPTYVRSFSARSRDLGLSSANPDFVLPLQISRHYGEDTGVGVEVARHFISRENDAWQAGVFASTQCTVKLLCLAEVNATRVDREATHTTLNFGAHYPLSDNFQLMGSLGRDIAGPDKRTLIFYAGIQLLR